MSDEIEITTKFCHPYMNFGGDGCNDVILKVPKIEAVKLQSVALSGNENQGFSFGIVLIFYLIAKSVGAVIAIFK